MTKSHVCRNEEKTKTKKNTPQGGARAILALLLAVFKSF